MQELPQAGFVFCFLDIALAEDLFVLSSVSCARPSVVFILNTRHALSNFLILSFLQHRLFVCRWQTRPIDLLASQRHLLLRLLEVESAQVPLNPVVAPFDLRLDVLSDHVYASVLVQEGLSAVLQVLTSLFEPCVDVVVLESLPCFDRVVRFLS